MTKEMLIESVSKQLSEDYSKAQIKRMLDATFDSIQKITKKEGSLMLVGFGTFKVMKRKARNGRNPQTGKTIKIPAKKVVKFKPSKDFL
jgi:DNA-binding protein HU-beta